MAFPAAAVAGSVPDRLAAVADRVGDRPALVTADGTRTYEWLRRETARLAGGLGRTGVPVEGSPVAVLAGHGPEQVAAILGVMHAGGLAAVLDPEAAPAVTRAVLEDAHAVTLVHDDASAELAADLAPRLQRRSLAELDGPEARPSARSTDGAMLAYTSGTTGVPKAALLSHAALLHMTRGAADALAIAPSDRLPMLFPASLAVAAYPMLLPLLCGAALCPFDVRSLGLAPLPGWLAETGVSVLYLSPTVARFLAAMPAAEVPSLRVIVLGGERVDQAAVAAVRTAFGDRALVANGYGTTETGVLTFYVAGHDEPPRSGQIPAGWPIEGVTLRVVGADGRPAAPGVDGDLEVVGDHLFDGYWRRPDATALVLRSTPLGRAYRTGDVARLDRVGCLELVGRSDTQLKVRGHRVAPGEVEQALLAQDGVRDAVVEARPDALGTLRLVAWVVPTSPQSRLSGTALRSALAETCPSAMVPQHVTVLDELPLLPNGKTDRRALPEPGSSRPLPRGSYVAPSDGIEARLVGLWEEVLGVQPVGVEDAFFDLGGGSLDAARMLARVEEELGVYLPMSVLLDARTVADLTATLRGVGAVPQTTTSVVEVTPLGRGAATAAETPLFFVHDLFGTAWVLRPLADLLGGHPPLWGFESPLLAGEYAPFHTLDEMATRYVADLRAVQPSGPYRLAGYSFGGVLAFEMARQLAVQGAEVSFLGVIDVGPGYRGRHFHPRKVLDKPPMFVPGPLEEGSTWRARLRFLAELADDDVRQAALHASLVTGLDRWTDPLLFRLDRARRGRIAPRHRNWYAWREHWRLARAYRWQGRRVPGDLTLFWAQESGSTDATMGWGDHVGGEVHVVRLDAPHETLMQAGTVERLAAPLRALVRGDDPTPWTDRERVRSAPRAARPG